MKPWLSVVMPVHSGEAWIEASLRSIAAERALGVEVIVLDSGPGPESASIARSFEKDLPLRLIPDSPLSWLAKTNAGVAMASAEYVCWLHQDDLWLPGRAAAVRCWIDLAPRAALHFAGSRVVDQSGRRLGTWCCPFRGEAEIDGSLFLERLLVQNFISAPAPVFRRDSWLACGGLDEVLWYTGDWDVWLKLGEAGAVWHHPEITTAFRVHGSSLTVTGSGDSAEFGDQMKLVLERHIPRLLRNRRKVEAASLVSIKVNQALAAAAGRRWGAVLPAMASVLALGPWGVRRYLRDSRIADRLLPRLRAKLTGTF